MKDLCSAGHKICKTGNLVKSPERGHNRGNGCDYDRKACHAFGHITNRSKFTDAGNCSHNDAERSKRNSQRFRLHEHSVSVKTGQKIKRADNFCQNNGHSKHGNQSLFEFHALEKSYAYAKCNDNETQRFCLGDKLIGVQQRQRIESSDNGRHKHGNSKNRSGSALTFLCHSGKERNKKHKSGNNGGTLNDRILIQITDILDGNSENQDRGGHGQNSNADLGGFPGGEFGKTHNGGKYHQHGINDSRSSPGVFRIKFRKFLDDFRQNEYGGRHQQNGYACPGGILSGRPGDQRHGFHHDKDRYKL